MKTRMFIYEIDYIITNIPFNHEICKLLHIEFIQELGLSLLMTDAAISRSCICLLCIHFDQKFYYRKQ